MKTFCVQTLGCKVNHYEGEQIAALLRSRGLAEADVAHADLRVVNSCSVTVEAASKSRATSRRLVRLPLLGEGHTGSVDDAANAGSLSNADAACATTKAPGTGPATQAARLTHLEEPRCSPAAPSCDAPAAGGPARRPRVIVTGCWATSDPSEAAALPGVDAVITHHGDVAAELDRLLQLWQEQDREGGRTGAEESDPFSRPERTARHAPADSPIEQNTPPVEPPSERLRNDGWITEAGSPAGTRTGESKATSPEKVNLQIYAPSVEGGPINPEILSADVGPEPWPSTNHAGLPRRAPAGPGTARLPLLGQHQGGRQRAFLKVQDGCDAHCTYCIIPRLRPTPWSKPVDDAVEEARRLVAAGHAEIVLTGIFLGAYGRATALRRRRDAERGADPLAQLVDALCTRVPGLRRLRLSSLEPGDLTDELLAALRGHAQVVPHLHLPLQSGSDAMLRRMNRQYGRDDFLRMVDRVRGAFDRPALTTDVIVAFPGEDDEAFRKTAEVVDYAGFIHVHAFAYSPRPGTAAARWRGRPNGTVAGERIEELRRRAAAHDLAFRRRFIGEAVEVMVEQDADDSVSAGPTPHGRSERYFDVAFDHDGVRPGDLARVRVEEVALQSTRGTCLSIERPAGGVA